MKCRICQGELEEPTYRQLYPHFHFPAHVEWEACHRNLLNRQFRGIYHDVPKLIELGNISPAHADIVSHIKNKESLELLLKYTPLKTFINESFPPAQLTEDLGDWSMKEVALHKDVYRKLVALELEHNLENPTTLTVTCQHVVKALETGKFPLEHPLYHGQYPVPRSTQVIRVPHLLQDAVKEPWLSFHYSLERILTVYVELVPIPARYLDLAYSVIRNEIRPSTLQRKLGYQQTAVLSLIAVPDLPSQDKRFLLKQGLERLNLEEVAQEAKALKDGPRTSTRIDKTELERLKEVAKQYHVPVYKLATALLRQAKRLST